MHVAKYVTGWPLQSAGGRGAPSGRDSRPTATSASLRRWRGSAGDHHLAGADGRVIREYVGSGRLVGLAAEMEAAARAERPGCLWLPRRQPVCHN